MSPELAVAIDIAAPFVAAVIGYSARAWVGRLVEDRLEVRVRAFCDRFERRIERLEQAARSPEVRDRLQELIIRMTVLERRLTHGSRVDRADRADLDA